LRFEDSIKLCKEAAKISQRIGISALQIKDPNIVKKHLRQAKELALNS
jgi:hypothetical protein